MRNLQSDVICDVALISVNFHGTDGNDDLPRIVESCRIWPTMVMFPLRAAPIQIMHGNPTDLIPFDENVLVSDDGVAHAIRLALGASQSEDEVARDDRALELERHVRRREEPLCRPNVVQQARQRVRLHRRRVLVELPLREVRFHECGSIDEDAVAVVERLFIKLFLHQPVIICGHERWRHGKRRMPEPTWANARTSWTRAVVGSGKSSTVKRSWLGFGFDAVG